MKLKFNCKGCGIVFIPNRSNQLYHNSKCRNKCNMIAFRKCRENAHNKLYKANQIDLILSTLYYEGKEVYISKDEFEKYMIDINSCTYIKEIDSQIEEIAFLKFKLIRTFKNNFKIEKNETTNYTKANGF
jgi:hypothetical protein